MRVVLRHECIAQKSVGWSFVDCHPLRCRHRKSRSLGDEIFKRLRVIALQRRGHAGIYQAYGESEGMDEGML
jgi:hypothetical protein